jgi:hypothetical protein
MRKNEKFKTTWIGHQLFFCIHLPETHARTIDEEGEGDEEKKEEEEKKTEKETKKEEAKEVEKSRIQKMRKKRKSWMRPQKSSVFHFPRQMRERSNQTRKENN